MGKHRSDEEKVQARAALKSLYNLCANRKFSQGDYFLASFIISETYQRYDVNLVDKKLHGLFEHYVNRGLINLVCLRTFGDKVNSRGYSINAERRDVALEECNSR